MGLYQWLRGESQFVNSKSKTRKSKPRSSYAEAASDYIEAPKPVSAKKSNPSVYHTGKAYNSDSAKKRKSERAAKKNKSERTVTVPNLWETPKVAKKSKTRKNTSLFGFLSSESVKPLVEHVPVSEELKHTVHSYVPIKRCPNGQHRNQDKEGRCDRISVIAREAKSRKKSRTLDSVKNAARELQSKRLKKRVGSKRQ